MNAIKTWWHGFEERHTGVAQFLMFFVFSNAVTVLQFVLMPLLRGWFNGTDLVNQDFQVLPVGSNVDGSQYYMFDYPAGEISDGGGGGLAYFLAVQITLAVAQIINFFLQRNITFKSNTSAWVAAAWYFLAYVIITFVAAAAQGFYKVPVYDFFMDTLGWGSTGESVADVVTMIINAAISFWVFFPIFKIIFKRVPDDEDADPVGAGQVTDASVAQSGNAASGADNAASGAGNTPASSSVESADAAAPAQATPTNDAGPEGR